MAARSFQDPPLDALSGGVDELMAEVRDTAYYSHDMAPVPRERRRWGTKDLAVLWISMSACVPTYMLASGMIDQGMNWWQAILTIFLGNLIVLVPMVLNAHAGTKYGIPFPVYCRPSFGLLVRMCRRCCGRSWLVAGLAFRRGSAGRRSIRLSRRLLSMNSSPTGSRRPTSPGSASTRAQLGCFLFFWAINMFVIFKGIESIRILLEHQGAAA